MKRKIRKNKNKIILIAVFLVLLIGVILLVRHFLTNNSKSILAYEKNGKIYAYINTKSYSLGKGELSTVKISNMKDPQFLYKIGNQLYLFKNQKPIKLLKDIQQYAFYDDLVVMLTKNNDLYVYNGKTKKIEEKIDEVIGSNSDYLIYGKEKILNRVDVKTLKVTKITDFYNNAEISEDKSKITYLSNSDQLMVSNFKKSTKQKEANKVLRYFCDSSCDSYYYLTYDTKTLYHIDKKGKKVSIATDVVDINQTDPEQKVVVYSKQGKEALATYINISGKDIQMPKDTGINDFSIADNYIYYSTYIGDNYAISLKDKKPIKIASENNENYINSDGKYYLTITKKNQKDLYLINKTKKKKVATSVISGSVKGREDSNLLCYEKQEDSKTQLLCKRNGRKEKNIDSNIRDYQISKQNIYYLKDYDVNKKASDLYVYSNHSKKILENINNYLLPLED